ncbi:MAG: class III lanthionine synthetase LanKC [Actinocatenispora sp.]
MDTRYENYCAADPVFYDRLTAARRQRDFALAARELPTGWRRQEHEDWLIHTPDGRSLPAQGWKIHISACLDNAERVLDSCWRYCVEQGVAFKYLRGPHILLMRNSKYAARGSSGKLVTIYPTDDADCERILTGLDALIGGEAGPYILSDLRWRRGPLFVRYGGFASRHCLSDQGDMVPAIEDPSGTLVPDRRGPVFALPEWLTLPDFLAPELAARNAVTVAGLPYRVDKVLHFSNGGGIYQATDTRSGRTVVLKEARPYAGLDSVGEDAVTRLDREARMLGRLADVAEVPDVLDRFTVGEHEFLVLQHIDGVPLNRELVGRYPLGGADISPAARADFRDWALRTVDQVEAAVRRVHAHGVVYGDLHLFNVVVRPDGTPCLLDFEVAAGIEEGRPPALRNQGFAAPRDRTGFAVDEYALACLRLALFLPMTDLLRLRPTKARHLAEVIAEQFDLSAGYLDRAVETILGAPARTAATPAKDRTHRAVVTSPPGSAQGAPTHDDDLHGVTDPDRWPQVRSALTRAILASATPERDDRLFPGDVEQFRTGGLNLAHGAAGVLYALSVTGAGRFPEHDQWLLDRATRQGPGMRLGLYDGLHGVAFTLDHLGYRQPALDVLDLCLAQPWESVGPDLTGGLAGIGLNLARLGDRTAEPELHRLSARAADLLAERLGTVSSVPEISGGPHPRAGLMHGSSGVALLFLDRYDRAGDKRFLDLARTALEQDLRRCLLREDGSLNVNEGWRTMPYLESGSVGVGLALAAYLARRPDDQLAVAAERIRRAANSPFYVQSGLFAGRAGIAYHLAELARAGDDAARIGDETVRDVLQRQVRSLSWHAMPYGGGIAFPGAQLLRLSMDLATGTAGVLLAVGAACHSERVGLPLVSGIAPDTTTSSRVHSAGGSHDLRG